MGYYLVIQQPWCSLDAYHLEEPHGLRVLILTSNYYLLL